MVCYCQQSNKAEAVLLVWGFHIFCQGLYTTTSTLIHTVKDLLYTGHVFKYTHSTNLTAHRQPHQSNSRPKTGLSDGFGCSVCLCVYEGEKKQGQPEAIAVFPWRKPCAAQGQQ